jgi:hypothetical protein
MATKPKQKDTGKKALTSFAIKEGKKTTENMYRPSNLGKYATKASSAKAAKDAREDARETMREENRAKGTGKKPVNKKSKKG